METYKSFPLVGNLGAAATVRDAIDSNRIPHAIIIEGEEGTGKATLAKYISAAAVCPSAAKPCGACKSCHIVEVGSHPDVFTVSPEEGKKTISVDAIRNLRNEAYLKPNISDRRVFIITPADAMNEVSQNALLKVLEEPPASAVFLLVTDRASLLLPTVRSRCVTLTLSSVTTSQAKAWIEENTVGYSQEDINDAVMASGGNIGKTLEILEGGNVLLSDAKELLRLSENKKTYEMLIIFKKYERDRVATDELFKAMRHLVSLYTKEGIKSGRNISRLSGLYDLIAECQKSLTLNINLPLLFAGFCSKI